MRLVSENSEADLAKREKLDEVERRFVDLASNVLRVVRGAGKPGDIGDQASALAWAYIEFEKVAGHYPFPEHIAEAANIAPTHDQLSKMSPENYEEVASEHQIIKGALQIAASRLLRQRTQESAGDNEMFEGMRRWEDNRDAANRKWCPAP